MDNWLKRDGKVQLISSLGWTKNVTNICSKTFNWIEQHFLYYHLSLKKLYKFIDYICNIQWDMLITP
jgi:hypothetical protein